MDLASATLSEVGFYDTYPADNNRSFNGAWSVYPFFESGSIVVNDRQNGLFVLRLNTDSEANLPGFDQLRVAGTAAFDGTLNVSLVPGFDAGDNTFEVAHYAVSTGNFHTVNSTDVEVQVRF